MRSRLSVQVEEHGGRGKGSQRVFRKKQTGTWNGNKRKFKRLVDAEAVVIRNDDVSMASDFDDIDKIYSIIREKIPNAEIWTAVTVFSQGEYGSIYEDLPLVGKTKSFLYDVDRAWLTLGKNAKEFDDGLGKIVSHGLIHIDHTRLSYDATLMSMLVSCRMLNTRVFVPPFGRINGNVMQVAVEHNIEIEASFPLGRWKSIEFNDFDPKHEKWYFHSWRFTPDSFGRKIDEGFERASVVSH